LIKNKIHKYDFLIIGAGMIGCLTALSLLKKKFKVLVVDKEDLSINDTRTLAVNAKSRDFLKYLNLWDELKQTQPIKNIYIKDYINCEDLIFENKEEDMGTVIYNKDLLFKARKILLDKKSLYKNINVSLEKLLQSKKTIISNKKIEFKKIILTTGKFFNNELIINKKTFDEGHISYVGFFNHTKKHQNNAYEIFTSKGPLAVLPAPNKSQKYSTFIYSSKIDHNIDIHSLISNNFKKTHGKIIFNRDIKSFTITATH
jgi:2-octaprenyl-6-methoxyphenol hydroxylase